MKTFMFFSKAIFCRPKHHSKHKGDDADHKGNLDLVTSVWPFWNHQTRQLFNIGDAQVDRKDILGDKPCFFCWIAPNLTWHKLNWQSGQSQHQPKFHQFHWWWTPRKGHLQTHRRETLSLQNLFSSIKVVLGPVTWCTLGISFSFFVRNLDQIVRVRFYQWFIESNWVDVFLLLFNLRVRGCSSFPKFRSDADGICILPAWVACCSKCFGKKDTNYIASSQISGVFHSRFSIFRKA